MRTCSRPATVISAASAPLGLGAGEQRHLCRSVPHSVWRAALRRSRRKLGLANKLGLKYVLAGVVGMLARCVFLSAFALADAGHAADIHLLPASNASAGFAGVVIDGTIVSGDAAKFDAITAGYQSGIVILNSDGGVAIEGMEIGEAIRARPAKPVGMVTIVLDGNRCASACALVFAGGQIREMQAHALLGAHAVYVTGTDGVSRETGQGNAMVGAYLTKLGYSYQTVAAMTSAAPGDMTWLNPAEARQIGLGVLTVDQNANIVVYADGSVPGAPAPQVATPPASSTPVAALPPPLALSPQLTPVDQQTYGAASQQFRVGAPGTFPLVPGGLQATLSGEPASTRAGFFAVGVITAVDVEAYCATQPTGDATTKCRSDYETAIGSRVVANADCTNGFVTYSFRGKTRATRYAGGNIDTVNFDSRVAPAMLDAQWHMLCAGE